MKPAGLPVALAALLVLAGCSTAGTQFPLPSASGLRPGETTAADVRRAYGEPRRARAWTDPEPAALAKEVPSPFGYARVSGVLRELDYYHEDRHGEAVATGVEPSRSTHLWFWNDRLVGYRAHSSFRSDAPTLDETYAASIKPYQTWQRDIVAVLGEPSGLRVHPLVPTEDRTLLTWTSFEFDRGKRESRLRRLSVLVDRLGIVVNVRYDTATDPIKPPPVPTYNPIPIYVPPVRKK